MVTTRKIPQPKMHANDEPVNAQLVKALRFCLSVIRKNGLFDVSDRLAEEKAVAALKRAGEIAR
jgi:hypothetical protein